MEDTNLGSSVTSSKNINNLPLRGITFLIVAVLTLVAIYFIGSFLLKKSEGPYEYKPFNVLGDDTLPESFPEDIPVDRNTIIGGSSALDTERNILETDVTYVTDASIEELVVTYTSYLKSRNYELKGADQSDATHVSLYGKNESSDISILIYPEESSVSVYNVNISYIERKNNEENN